jgi:hypothetical protein
MIDSINIENINFNETLREAFVMACNIAKDATRELLSATEQYIRENIDPKRYKFKKMVEKTILTSFGELMFERAYYLDRENDEYVYLLDKYLNREVGRAVRDSIRENKKKKKYGGVQSHTEVFNGKVTTLTTMLKDLVDNSA